MLFATHATHKKTLGHLRIFDNFYFTKQTLVDKKLSCWATNYRDSNIEQERNLKNLKSP